MSARLFWSHAGPAADRGLPQVGPPKAQGARPPPEQLRLRRGRLGATDRTLHPRPHLSRRARNFDHQMLRLASRFVLCVRERVPRLDARARALRPLRRPAHHADRRLVHPRRIRPRARRVRLLHLALPARAPPVGELGLDRRDAHPDALDHLAGFSSQNQPPLFLFPNHPPMFCLRIPPPHVFVSEPPPPMCCLQITPFPLTCHTPLPPPHTAF